MQDKLKAWKWQWWRQQFHIQNMRPLCHSLSSPGFWLSHHAAHSVKVQQKCVRFKFELEWAVHGNKVHQNQALVGVNSVGYIACQTQTGVGVNRLHTRRGPRLCSRRGKPLAWGGAPGPSQDPMGTLGAPWCRLPSTAHTSGTNTPPDSVHL